MRAFTAYGILVVCCNAASTTVLEPLSRETQLQKANWLDKHIISRLATPWGFGRAQLYRLLDPAAPTVFYNQYGTCWLNAVVQILFSLPNISEMIDSINSVFLLKIALRQLETDKRNNRPIVDLDRLRNTLPESLKTCWGSPTDTVMKFFMENLTLLAEKSSTANFYLFRGEVAFEHLQGTSIVGSRRMDPITDDVFRASRMIHEGLRSCMALRPILFINVLYLKENGYSHVDEVPFIITLLDASHNEVTYELIAVNKSGPDPLGNPHTWAYVLHREQWWELNNARATRWTAAQMRQELKGNIQMMVYNRLIES